jgi:hypothetical protein
MLALRRTVKKLVLPTALHTTFLTIAYPLRPPVPSVRGKANRNSSTRIFGSHVVLDRGRS